MMRNMSAPYQDIVRLNLIEGIFDDVKFGINENVGTSLETVQANGGLYPNAGVESLYLSSSSSGDLTVGVEVIGLDSDGDVLRQTVITNGQSGVLLPEQYWKGTFRQSVEGAVDPLGDLWVGTEVSPAGGIPAAANQRGYIPRKALNEEWNQSQMSRLVVPLGTIALIVPTLVTVTRNDDADVSLWIRKNGGVWKNKTPLNLFQSGLNVPLNFGAPELAEVEFRTKALISTANVAAAFGYRLFVLGPNVQQEIDEFTTRFLGV